MPKYTHQPLDDPASEFRLLQISKDPVTQQPQCTLQKYSLTDCPDYIALSYTWGEPTPTRSVAVNGANIEARQNLFNFLNAYTTEPWGVTDVEKPIFCWIDQMCINQEDQVECSGQVRIMHKIYKQAKKVLVWLGCDPDMIEAVRKLRDGEYDNHWALGTLISHPYFSRIWTVQEITLSSDEPLIVCGGLELDWQSVRLIVLPDPQQSRKLGVWLLIRGTDRFLRITTMQDCILLHCANKCHDPRDKVYGLLGLTPESWRVRVDYTKEVLEVYFDAVAALYEELFDLLDPHCLYPKGLTDMASPEAYRDTLVSLAISMGVHKRHCRALLSFLESIQATYLDTSIRNVQYTYTGRIYTRVRAQPSSERIHAPGEEEAEIEVSWGSITATRRKPLLRDIIPEMGLQLASTTAESIVEQSGDSVLALDRWWCKHDGEIHYFDCFDPYSDESSSGSSDDSLDNGLGDGLHACLDEE